MSCSCPWIAGKGRCGTRRPGISTARCARSSSILPTRHRSHWCSIKIIEPIKPPADTQWVKHERIQSRLLTEFWGRPMYLGAHVLLPKGWAEHPQARYPLMINHGHFPADFDGFRPEPPDPKLAPDYSERFRLSGYNRLQQELAHQLYKDWTGEGFPRVLAIEIQHANPYYDDSYAVNSENVGPYADAIQQELIPYLEKKYRALGTGWSRFVYGGSTGGWEALAVQVKYPDFYNGAFAACPDPIDFRAYGSVNIYEDRNAYVVDAAFKQTPRIAMRDYLGRPTATLEEVNRLELVLGTNSRSGGQWDIWQAVFSPVGADGYPRPIWNKRTGEIDRNVASYWRDNFDLVHIMRRDWQKGLGEKLRGKIHLYVGELDNYFLEVGRLPGAGIPGVDPQSALRRRDRLRTARRALLERRPHSSECRVALAISPDVHTDRGRAHSQDCAGGRGSGQLELLKEVFDRMNRMDRMSEAEKYPVHPVHPVHPVQSSLFISSRHHFVLVVGLLAVAQYRLQLRIAASLGS